MSPWVSQSVSESQGHLLSYFGQLKRFKQMEQIFHILRKGCQGSPELNSKHYWICFEGSINIEEYIILARVHVLQQHYIFKPATLQSLWTAIQVETLFHWTVFYFSSASLLWQITIVSVDKHFPPRLSMPSALNWNQRETQSWFGYSNIYFRQNI